MKDLLEDIESYSDETAVNFNKSIIYFIDDYFDKTVSHLNSLLKNQRTFLCCGIEWREFLSMKIVVKRRFFIQNVYCNLSFILFRDLPI
jgi:hypothetical protein